MGKVAKILSTPFEAIGSLVSPKLPKASMELPSVATAQVEETKADLTAEQEAAKKKRAALYGTEGGASGQEIATGGVSARGNIFGN